MCLDSVKSVKSEKLPKDQYHMGWKVVRINKDKQTFDSLYNIDMPLNKWLRCKRPLCDILYTGSNSDRTYPAGFHIFTTREAARRWNVTSCMTSHVVKVRYRRVVARGTQNWRECVVAKEMYVEKPKSIK